MKQFSCILVFALFLFQYGYSQKADFGKSSGKKSFNPIFFYDTLFDRKIAIKESNQLIPRNEFDKYVLNDIQRYIIFNSNAATYPSFTLDALEQNISLNFSRVVNKTEEADVVKSTTDKASILSQDLSTSKGRYVAVSAGLTAAYNTNSTSAPIYSSGAFVNDLKGKILVHVFAKGRASFNSGKPKSVFIDTLSKFIVTARDKHLEYKNWQERATAIENDLAKFDEKLWARTKVIDLAKVAEKDSLLKELDNILQNRAPFYTRYIQWLSFGLNEIGTPSYKTFDIAAKEDEMFKDRRIFVIHPTIGYSLLRVHNKSVKDFETSALPIQKRNQETLLFFNATLGFQKTSNIGQNGIKGADYIVTKTVVNSTGTAVEKQEKIKAYDHSRLDFFWRATFSGELLYLFIPKYKVGISQRFEYFAPLWDNNDEYLTQLTNSLGVVFPIQNKKDKVATLMQAYWKCGGFVKNEFVNEFGLKLGIPINVSVD